MKRPLGLLGADFGRACCGEEGGVEGGGGFCDLLDCLPPGLLGADFGPAWVGEEGGVEGGGGLCEIWECLPM